MRRIKKLSFFKAFSLTDKLNNFLHLLLIFRGVGQIKWECPQLHPQTTINVFINKFG